MANLEPLGLTLVIGLLSACGSRIDLNVDAGSTSTSSNSRSASSVASTGLVIVPITGVENNLAVPPCASGSEHPNICCLGGPYTATVCTKDLSRPFGPCASGQFAYPDANICCSLENESNCFASIAINTVNYGCFNPCAPGAYPDQTGETLCWYGIGAFSEPIDPYVAPFGYQDGYCPTPCPAGWSTPAGAQVDLCCQTGLNGVRCYSQSDRIDMLDGCGGHETSDGRNCFEVVNGDGKFSAYGSWTLEREDDDCGIEPDECYVFGTVACPERPDLAIEVVWTSGGVNKLEI